MSGLTDADEKQALQSIADKKSDGETLAVKYAAYL